MHNSQADHSHVRVLNNETKSSFGRTRFQEIVLKKFHWGDFRKSSETLGQEIEKELGEPLKEGEFAMVVSLSKRVIRLVFPITEVEHVTPGGAVKGRLRIRPSMDHRIIDGGTFNVHEIENYCNRMGFSIKNRKRIEAALRAEN